MQEVASGLLLAAGLSVDHTPAELVHSAIRQVDLKRIEDTSDYVEEMFRKAASSATSAGASEHRKLRCIIQGSNISSGAFGV